jgi:polyhydroxyalkanoate synthesis regulator phasin
MAKNVKGRNKPKLPREIKIITGPISVARASDADFLPREPISQRPEQHFGLGWVKKKPVKALTKPIEELRGQIADIVKALSLCVAEKAELEEIAVGLAVSGEGDIGIVSVGAEVSIELTYKLKH